MQIILTIKLFHGRAIRSKNSRIKLATKMKSEVKTSAPASPNWKDAR